MLLRSVTARIPLTRMAGEGAEHSEVGEGSADDEIVRVLAHGGGVAGSGAVAPGRI